jgi:hypothetical protein
MDRTFNINRMYKSWIIALLTALFIYGCGGGGSGGATPGTGSVAILLTDGPSEDFDEIKLTITEIRLLGDDEQVVIFQGEETIDLLELENHSDLFTITDGVPEGSYEKIRLILSDVTLIKNGEDGNPIVEHQIENLPGNGKLDLNPRGSFYIAAGETTSLQIDIDADKAIHIKQTGNEKKYQFRPVVFVDIVDHLEPGKLIRHTGTVYRIEDDSFIMCKEVVISSTKSDADDCVKVNVAEASLFDNQGKQVELGNLAVGDHVIVYGKIAEHADSDPVSVSSLDSHSSDNDDSRDDINDDSNDDVNDDEDEAEIELTLDAIMVAIGTADDFLKLSGVVSTAFAANAFAMSVDANQGFTADSILTVMLNDSTPVITKQGDALDPSTALVEGTPVQSKGVMMVGSDSVLKSILVIADVAAEDTAAPGTISFIAEDLSSINIQTTEGEVCVDLDSDTDFYQIIDKDSVEISAGDLVEGTVAEVYGDMGDTCITADDVLVFP